MPSTPDSSPARKATASVRARDAEARFDALLDAAVDAIIQIDARGHILRFNHAAERIFGYDFDEVYDCNVSMLMPQPYRDEHDGYLDHYLDTREAKIIGIGREVLGLHKDGHSFPIDLSVGEVKGDKHSSFVGIIRDISERKRIEHESDELRNELAHVARVGSLGEMASAIAHELNQPLTAIASYARASHRLLSADENNRAECLDAMDKIAAQAERAGDIIQRLRSMLRQGDQERESLDCNDLIHDLLSLIDLELRAQPIELHLELADNLLPVMADYLQLQQVIHNLVRNAIEAMLESDTGKAVLIRTTNTSGYVNIEVSDEGPGIGEQNMEKLFEPFYSTKKNGMGMGLPLCRTITRAHGGTLKVGNRQPTGANFTLQLPVANGK